MFYNYDLNGFFDDISSILNRTHFLHHVVQILHNQAIEKKILRSQIHLYLIEEATELT